MSAALSENPASVIHSLNLAHNSLDNQGRGGGGGTWELCSHTWLTWLNAPPLDATGVSNLIQQVCRLSKGLRLLNLSKTSLTSKGLHRGCTFKTGYQTGNIVARQFFPLATCGTAAKKMISHWPKFSHRLQTKNKGWQDDCDFKYNSEQIFFYVHFSVIDF